MMTEHRILSCLRRYNGVIGFIPMEDVMQEIRIALFLSKDDREALRLASSAVYRLAADFGYSRRKGKDKFGPFYGKVEFSEEEEDVLSDIERFYIAEEGTARQVAARYGIEYTNRLQKILCACFPKHRKTKKKKERLN